MESLDIHLKDLILRDLHKTPKKKRIQFDIFDELQISLSTEQLIGYRKQLVMEGLITEENPEDLDSPIEVTPKGYEVIHLHGSYGTFINSIQQAEVLRKESEKLQAQNLKLKKYSTIITITLSILSFITGILLSDLIKGIIK
ncbi:MAG: hypothetical protein EGP71_06560 [Bacteroides thetaiotaomicron]|jgi:hypothetical protein|nr:hypothetical protein [Bacteroides thetaiotaomicron]